MAGETDNGEDGRGGAKPAMPGRRHEAVDAMTGHGGGGRASLCT
jgi:hypothetical protein